MERPCSENWIDPYGDFRGDALHSAPVAAEPRSIALRDSLDGPDFAESGGLYYRENYEQSAGKVEFQKEVKRSGEGALKLSIKPLCGASSDGCSERAEIWKRPRCASPTMKASGTVSPSNSPTRSRRTTTVISSPNGSARSTPAPRAISSPFLALRIRNGKLFATVETNYIQPTAQPASNGSAGDMRVRIDPGLAWGQKPIRCGPGRHRGWLDARGWRDLRGLHRRHSGDRSRTRHRHAVRPGPELRHLPEKPGGRLGHIEIFANGKPVVTVKGHIGHADKGLGENQYFKFGPYRAAHTTSGRSIYDDFRRSPNCADVLTDGSLSGALIVERIPDRLVATLTAFSVPSTGKKALALSF